VVRRGRARIISGAARIGGSPWQPVAALQQEDFPA
jgi:hypothetical protein